MNHVCRLTVRWKRLIIAGRNERNADERRRNPLLIRQPGVIAARPGLPSDPILFLAGEVASGLRSSPGFYWSRAGRAFSCPEGPAEDRSSQSPVVRGSSRTIRRLVGGHRLLYVTVVRADDQPGTIGPHCPTMQLEQVVTSRKLILESSDYLERMPRNHCHCCNEYFGANLRRVAKNRKTGHSTRIKSSIFSSVWRWQPFD